ncbi:hypothetical protein GUJ93_ZPchr0013g35718 [Zizania palustris]|uniref:Uncharacterized protein n=1 Tax=Zizania palustris TaxID=103762 RepID=A0A8J5X5V8_ZIZPA|nr:hypothetical protein GUJ93_ZPchr0013g35718 [Zizania palustris]
MEGVARATMSAASASASTTRLPSLAVTTAATCSVAAMTLELSHGAMGSEMGAEAGKLPTTHGASTSRGKEEDDDAVVEIDGAAGKLAVAPRAYKPATMAEEEAVGAVGKAGAAAT